jgi:hypothetical protein
MGKLLGEETGSGSGCGPMVERAKELWKKPRTWIYFSVWIPIREWAAL